ncbi:hypothetical protein halTADL_3042 [Halohasta litchfieldiae]|jgi:hypothetical protein|uniref:Uncharacterized protein n=1 Tax=Halohasta litchfieldiae TaxID=1073996 RepID=A0A1H6RC50_9EURY|nr:hypothetical protein [Halohasta litchfieldiae]ATW89744.1 hypothetical protein halTADL_3042 [Halohasta litchfieldiae]SEI53418.1 hypothetical protein SAMN05444271_10283 [Halohasta litchfieldiae]
MSDTDDTSHEAGLGLMFLLGGIALLIFVTGIAVIWYLSYAG